jgi:hypothetical protein
MEEAPENGKESSHSAHAKGMNEWNGWELFRNETTNKIVIPRTLKLTKEWKKLHFFVLLYLGCIVEFSE